MNYYFFGQEIVYDFNLIHYNKYCHLIISTKHVATSIVLAMACFSNIIAKMLRHSSF